ncbi:class I SAM-dependent methyltransferase [Brevibacillus migulae]|uniref:class I SAM-dependent methyltransferase n=1 Tax=Brevibacillus migulae TaxID=1644114 RepID=UPI00142F4F78|nr:class I SAM-dependent methyltransferase [Brevibacillus migulae]
MEFTGERVVPGKVPIDLYREHITRYLFAKSFIQPGDKVLDVGCGTGYGTYELACIPNANVIGIDISHEAISYGTENFIKDNLEYLQMDCTQLELEESVFDAVVSFEVIEHLEQTEKYLNEIKKVLKEEGVFIVSTPNKKMYSDVQSDYENPYHVKEYYLNEFIAILKREFTNVSIYLQDFIQGITIKPFMLENESLGYVTKVPLEDTKVDPESTSFFVAVCSNVDVDVIEELIFPFTNSNIISEKDKWISVLQEEVSKRDESVYRLQEENEEKDKWISALRHEVVQRDESMLRLRQESEEKDKWISALRHEVVQRDESMLRLRQESEEKDKWISALRHEVVQRDESMLRLRQESEEKDKWISALRHEVVKRDESVSRLQQENEEKDKWISTLRHEVVKRDESVLRLQQENEEKDKWISALKEEISKRDESVLKLQEENKEKEKWISSLKEEVVKRDESVMLLQQANEEWGKIVDTLKEEIRKRDINILSLESKINSY